MSTQHGVTDSKYLLETVLAWQPLGQEGDAIFLHGSPNWPHAVSFSQENPSRPILILINFKFQHGRRCPASTVIAATVFTSSCCNKFSNQLNSLKYLSTPFDTGRGLFIHHGVVAIATNCPTSSARGLEVSMLSNSPVNRYTTRI